MIEFGGGHHASVEVAPEVVIPPDYDNTKERARLDLRHVSAELRVRAVARSANDILEVLGNAKERSGHPAEVPGLLISVPNVLTPAHSRRSRLRLSREASLQNRHFLFEDLNFLLGSPSDVELGGGPRDYNVARPWVRRTISGVPAEKCAGLPAPAQNSPTL
jgi:hypothetical protein